MRAVLLTVVACLLGSVTVSSTPLPFTFDKPAISASNDTLPYVSGLSTLYDEVSSANRAFEAAIVANDANQLAALYTPESSLLPPNAPTVVGNAAIGEFWKSTRSGMGVWKILLPVIDEIGPLAAGTGGEWIFQRSRFTLYDQQGNVLGNGKWIGIMKRVNGNWLLHSDIFNADS